ncbi:hypothetical protein Lal_00000401 [Lupinus albus]|uniref:Uncharacterized protein n=1 Tax=Lupinus albus TaxID=3870 RepID=A0A6A5LI55_LUPAL|nr:hypothetical protein Lalb_Chr21g0304741 [Lupinus albus]KAF1860986.1 hypothetical protein Lal_00000401 [Lupinus albus]
MANKNVALLVVCFVLVATVNAEMSTEEKAAKCNNYCFKACMFPSKFCSWWCHGRCDNPILWDDGSEEASLMAMKFRVPAHAPSQSKIKSQL